MANFPDNSKVKKQIEPVVQSETKAGKSNVGDDIKHYVVDECIIPAAKNTGAAIVSGIVKGITDGILNGFSMLIFGEAGKIQTTQAPRVNNPWGGFGMAANYSLASNASAYNNASSLKKQQEQVAGMAFKFRPILLKTFEDAEAVRASLAEMVASYGKVSVMEAYKFANLPSDFTQDAWGWYDVSSASIIETGIPDFPYQLYLPRPLSLK